jgi:phosphohistidine swiveling domain-containing protein
MIHGAYGKFPAVFLVDKGNWQLYFPNSLVSKLASIGYTNALQKDFLSNFRIASRQMLKEISHFHRLQKQAISLTGDNFIDFFDSLMNLVARFFKLYTVTEFFYSGKIDQQIYEWTKRTHPTEVSKAVNQLLNGKYRGSLPTNIKQLADFLKEIGALRFKLRDNINQLYMGDGVYLGVMQSFMCLTGRDDFSELTIGEIQDIMAGESVPNAEKRRELMVVFKNKKDWQFLSNIKARQMIKSIRRSLTTSQEVKGRIASPGKALGIARVYSLNRFPDFKRFKKGDILVAGTTGPELMTALQRAGAVVTNEGGLMSHAAVVTRELGIPCIIGT